MLNILAVATLVPIISHKHYIQRRRTTSEGKSVTVAYCVSKWRNPQLILPYYITWTMVCDIVPLLLITVTHIVMFIMLRIQFRQRNLSTNPQRLRKLQKISKRFVIIIVMFFILVLPHGIFLVVVAYLQDRHPTFVKTHIFTLLHWEDILTILAAFNSVINPLVYGRLHRKVMKSCCMMWNFVHRTFHKNHKWSPNANYSKRERAITELYTHS